MLVENFRTGVLDRLGFPMEELTRLNPRLVVLSITGFGHDGPQGGRPGYDQIAQGEAGLMSLTGPGPDDPTRIGVPIGDLLAGMYGAYGVVAALHERERTGLGRVVRTSLLAAIVGVHAFQGTNYTVAGQVGHAQGNLHPSLQPYGSYRCADAIIQVAVGSEKLWAKFAPMVGLAVDDPRFAVNADRVVNRAELADAINAAFGERAVDELLPELAAAGIPAGEVRTIDRVYEWDQTKSQGLLLDVMHSTLGPITLPGPPIRLDGAGDAADGGRRRTRRRRRWASTRTACRRGSTPRTPAPCTPRGAHEHRARAGARVHARTGTRTDPPHPRRRARADPPGPGPRHLDELGHRTAPPGATGRGIRRRTARRRSQERRGRVGDHR